MSAYAITFPSRVFRERAPRRAPQRKKRVTVDHDHAFFLAKVEAPSGFEPEMEVLQTSALPLGDGADWKRIPRGKEHRIVPDAPQAIKEAGHALVRRQAPLVQ